MFKLKSLDKKGFGHVEMIVFAVVVLAIGGIGYFALRSSGAMPSNCWVRDVKIIKDPLQTTNNYVVMFYSIGSGVNKDAWTEITWDTVKDVKESTHPKYTGSNLIRHKYPLVRKETRRSLTIVAKCSGGGQTSWMGPYDQKAN